MNPFMFYAGCLMVAAAFWSVTQSHWKMMIVYIAFAVADFTLATVRA